MGNLLRSLGVGTIQIDPGPANLSLCRGHIQPGTAHLDLRLHEVFGFRDIPGDGYNCRPKNHRPGASVSVHGDGRAIDAGSPYARVDAGGTVLAYDFGPGDRASEWLSTGDRPRRLQLQSLLWNGRSWAPNRVPGWRPLSAGFPRHDDHLHLEQNVAGSELSPEAIDQVFADSGLLLLPPTIEELSMARSVAHPDAAHDTPGEVRFAKLITNGNAVRGMNGAKLLYRGNPVTDRPLKAPAVELIPIPESRLILAVPENGGAAESIRWA